MSIVSATTRAPICVWCSDRITGQTEGGKLIEFDGDVWHAKCLDHYKVAKSANDSADDDRDQT